MEKKIITISREFGAGGRTIGHLVADKLGIPFYDGKLVEDIAKESGYAVGTVSRVLNNHPDVSEKARKTIMEVVEKHHFKLNNNAKHLKQQASSGIAIIIKGSQNMLFASIVERLQGLIEEKDFACFIYYIGEEENEVEQAESVSFCEVPAFMRVLPVTNSGPVSTSTR